MVPTLMVGSASPFRSAEAPGCLPDQSSKSPPSRAYAKQFTLGRLSCASALGRL